MKNSSLPPNGEPQAEGNFLSKAHVPHDFEDGLMQRLTLAKLPSISELRTQQENFSEHFESGVFTRILLRSLPNVTAPEDFEDRVFAQIRANEERMIDLRVFKMAGGE